MTQQRHVIDIDPADAGPAAPAAAAPVSAPAAPQVLPALKPAGPPLQVAPPHVAAQPAYAAPPAMAMSQTVINVGSHKSVGGAVALAFFFGPLGMIYSTPVGAIVMFLVNLVVLIPTLGLGLLVTLPIGMVWAGVAASKHNERLGASVTQMVGSVPAMAPPR